MTSGPSGERVGDLQDRRDRRLMEQTAGGDEAAFAALFRVYAPSSMGLALRVLGDKALAEEVVQEVFLAVWRAARSYDAGRGSVRAWIFTQAHRRAVDAVRREEAGRRRDAHHAPLPGTGPEIDDVIDDDWLRSRRTDVRRVLGGLPREHRDVLELAYYAGMTQAQIATRLGLPIGTVKSRTLAAMRRMRDALAEGSGR